MFFLHATPTDLMNRSYPFPTMFSPPDPQLDTLFRRALRHAGRIGMAVTLGALLLLLVFVLAGCGSDESSSNASGSASADSTQSAGKTPADSTGQGAGSSASGGGGEDPGFFAQLASYTFSHPRREREMGTTCSASADYSGRSMPFHEMVIDNGNGFNTTHESFPTSTPQAQTPYVAYATWDPCGLYLGLTGSAVGAGDCGEYDGDCPLYDRPESPYRYWLVYLDTDPQGQSGSRNPKGDRPGPSELPFAADYLMEIRLDGVTVPVGDGYEYQGNAQLYERSSDWRVGLEESWRPMGRDALEIGDNSSSNFIEVALDLGAIGDPCTVQAIGWVADSQADEAFAFWPPPRGWKPPAKRDSSGTPQDSSAARPDTVRQGTGLTAPPDSTRRDSTGTARPDSARSSSRTSLAEADSAGGSRLRSVPIDSLQLDVYGFLLSADQKPNASANLNRSDFTMDRCQAQDGAPGE
jgi:hypothetical protein